MFLTDKIIDRKDFTRNLFNRSFFAIFALDYFLILLMIHLQSCSLAIYCVDNTNIGLVSWSTLYNVCTHDV